MGLGRWVRGGTWILKASKVRAVEEDWKTLGKELQQNGKVDLDT